MKNRTRRLSAIMATAVIASSTLCTPVVADTWNPWYSDGYTFDWSMPMGEWPTWTWGNGSASGNSSSSSGNTSSSSGNTIAAAKNPIPSTLYFTSYTSDAATRRNLAQSRIAAAEALLAQIDGTMFNLPSPTLNDITLSFGYMKYDHLVDIDNEDDANILIFNNRSNLTSAMSDIRTEEQNLLNNAFKPYLTYINKLISDNTYTATADGDTAEITAAKKKNGELLSQAKAKLSYTYDNADLFTSDYDDNSTIYRAVGLKNSKLSNSGITAGLENTSGLKYFPRVTINDAVLDWDDIDFLDITTDANDSWWFATDDGNTLSRSAYDYLTDDYYWFKGMLLPNYSELIEYGIDARDWKQYDGTTTSTDTATDTVPKPSVYYNASLNNASEYIYAVTDGYYIYYYPNADYANKACQNNKNCSVKGVYESTHSKSKPYFCFANGQYYATKTGSPYPDYTILMTLPAESDTNVKPDTGANNNTSSSNNNANNNTSGTNGSSAGSTSTKPADPTYYYIYNGYVYGDNGEKVASLTSRGYSDTNRWFNVDDGRFYVKEQTGKKGYYVNSDGKVETAKPSTDTSTSDKTNTAVLSEYYKIAKDYCFYLTDTELADIRENYETVYLKTKNGCIWKINGDDIETAVDTNFRINYSTDNIPQSLVQAVYRRNDVTATSQFQIGENVAWGMKASVTIKYRSAEYTNFIAKLYRYDSKSSSLILVDTSTIGEDRRVTFDNIDHGGDYLVTLN